MLRSSNFVIIKKHKVNVRYIQVTLETANKKKANEISFLHEIKQKLRVRKGY